MSQEKTEDSDSESGDFSVIVDSLEQTNEISIIKQMFLLDKVQEVLSEEEKNKLSNAINEIEKNQEKQSIETALIKKIENSSYWQASSDIISSIHPNSGYIVDLVFNADGTLHKKTIEIRKTGKQHRHVTPVAWVARVFNNVFDKAIQEKWDINTIITMLQSKILVFNHSITQEDQDCIQSVFDFFKSPTYQTPSGISSLTKIITHFYNTKSLLSFEDSYVEITYKINDCYLVVPANKLNIYKNEGAFVRAVCENLDSLEQQQKELSNSEKKQIIYNVFSLFDYLPLPKNVKTQKNQNKKEKKTRYSGEKMERLCEVAANHLHFFFEAYPKISGNKNFKRELFDGFLQYLTLGVNEENLFNLFSVENFFALRKNLIVKDANEIPSIEELKNKFTNKGEINGFSLQYKEITDFEDCLKDQVLEKLKQYAQDYFTEIQGLNKSSSDNSNSSDTSISSSSMKTPAKHSQDDEAFSSPWASPIFASGSFVTNTPGTPTKPMPTTTAASTAMTKNTYPNVVSKTPNTPESTPKKVGDNSTSEHILVDSSSEDKLIDTSIDASIDASNENEKGSSDGKKFS